MLLENDVFIIDGLQRVSALRKVAANDPDLAKGLRIGAEVRFNTTRDSENDLFTVVNVNRKSMSPSVILRNERNNHNSIATLYGLSMHDKNFAMVGKVCWDQQMHRGELMTALSFAKIAITLHRHTGPGGRHLSSTAKFGAVLDGLSSAVGLQCSTSGEPHHFSMTRWMLFWGLRGIKFTDRATHTRTTFLLQVAGMISDHEDFWEGTKLIIDAGQKSKLKSFPIEDPTIIRLGWRYGKCGWASVVPASDRPYQQGAPNVPQYAHSPDRALSYQQECIQNRK